MCEGNFSYYLKLDINELDEFHFSYIVSRFLVYHTKLSKVIKSESNIGCRYYEYILCKQVIHGYFVMFLYS